MLQTDINRLHSCARYARECSLAICARYARECASGLLATARAAPPFRNGNCSPAHSVATGLGREGVLTTPSPLRVA